VPAVLLLLAMALVQPGAAVQAKRGKKHSSSGPVVTRAQMELAQQMVRDAYKQGRPLETRRRVALMTRLLYTMRPEVMAEEKQDWAVELFRLAQQLPSETPEETNSRNAAIATAAARLAIYDADRALELLDTLPEENSSQPGARVMAARLVFNGYMQHHGSSGALVLLSHGRRWSEHGGFPYAASATALARLRSNEDAAEDFFRQELEIFERGQEGIFGISDFAVLLEQAVAMEAISEESAEEAGQSIVRQLRKLTVGESQQPSGGEEHALLSEEQKLLVMEAMDNVRVSAPKAYEAARRDVPELLAVKAKHTVPQVEAPKVDAALETAFHELAEAMRQRVGPKALQEVIGRDVALVNERYKDGACAACTSPDAQSWALVSLAAYAVPMTIGKQLSGIEDPFWRAYFTAIAAQQVGQPTRVADPTARKVVEKEEAEPE
jgi:hypothetical protein